MKILTLLWLWLSVMVLPVHAGQGTIEETDTAIIVEFTGDASDRMARHETPEQTYSRQPLRPTAPPTGTPLPAPAESPNAAPQAITAAETILPEVQQQRPETRTRERSARQERSSRPERAPRAEAGD